MGVNASWSPAFVFNRPLRQTVEVDPCRIVQGSVIRSLSCKVAAPQQPQDLANLGIQTPYHKTRSRTHSRHCAQYLPNTFLLLLISSDVSNTCSASSKSLSISPTPSPQPLCNTGRKGQLEILRLHTQKKTHALLRRNPIGIQ